MIIQNFKLMKEIRKFKSIGHLIFNMNWILMKLVKNLHHQNKKLKLMDK
jgi:hypothetical protein